MPKIINIPGGGAVTVYSDSVFISVPGDGSVEIDEQVVAGSSAPAYAVTTDAGANYVMVNATDYVVTQV